MAMSNHVLSSVITASPFRISFFGGGTDFPAYFNRNGGLVLATTIRQYSYVAVNSLPRLTEKRFRISYSQLENVDTVAEIRHNLIRATLTEHSSLIDDCFVDIHSYADLPSGTGVGSSSAFTVGLLGALHALNGNYVPPKELARQAIRIERDILGEVGGWQDQIMSAFGGFNLVRFHSDNFEVFPLVLGAGHRAAIEDSCWLYFTALTRSSDTVQKVSFSPSNIADKEHILNQTQELAEEALSALRSEKDSHAMVRRWGELLHRAWLLKREMSSSVSLPEIDRIYERARKAGAYGGKIIGAGGGGFLLIIGPSECRQDIDVAVGGLPRFPVRLEQDGGRVVYVCEKDY